MTGFPFSDVENTLVISCKHIIFGNDEICYVSHDVEDSLWQFLCGTSHSENEASVVSLQEIYKIDNSVGQIADLPLGSVAERINKAGEWRIHLHE